MVAYTGLHIIELGGNKEIYIREYIWMFRTYVKSIMM